MSNVNFQLVTELSTLVRRDFPLTDPTIVSPNGVRPLIDGEFLELDSAYKALRTGDNDSTSIDEGVSPSYAVHTERGRYDTQALRKPTLLFLHGYEAKTKVYKSAGLSLGSMLTVQDILIAGSTVVRRGLGVKTGSGKWIVGYVTKLTDGTGYMRFVRIPGMISA